MEAILSIVGSTMDKRKREDGEVGSSGVWSWMKGVTFKMVWSKRTSQPSLRKIWKRTFQVKRVKVQRL